MKKINYLIIVLLIFALVLSSCKSGGTSGFSLKNIFSKSSSTDSTIDYTDYKKRVLSPSLKLDRETTSRKIVIGDAFTLGLKIQNNGAYKINNGILKTIYNPFFLTLGTTKQGEIKSTYTLEGRSDIYPEGDFALVIFEGKSNTQIFGNQNLQKEVIKDTLSKIASISKIYNSEIAFLFEFPYKTILSHDFCINPVSSANFAVKTEAQSECYNSKKFTFSGQGAPVAIKTVDMNVLPFDKRNLVRFEILVENSGKGVVLGDIKINAEFSQEKTKCIKIDDKKNSLSLTPSSKKYKFICEALVDGNQPPYSTKLDVQLDYRYLISVKHKLAIEPRYAVNNTSSSKSLTGIE